MWGCGCATPGAAPRPTKLEYSTETLVRFHGTASMESVPVLTLILLSPKRQTSGDYDEYRNGTEATKFNAETHSKLFSDIVQLYGVEFN